MSKTALEINWTAASTGKKATTKISYINPESDSESLQTLAESLNELTTNIYGEANRVDTINVDTETSEKKFRNVQTTEIAQGNTVTITFNRAANETIKPAVFHYTTEDVTVLTPTNISTEPTIAQWTISLPQTAAVIYIGLTETTDFYSSYNRYAVS